MIPFQSSSLTGRSTLDEAITTGVAKALRNINDDIDMNQHRIRDLATPLLASDACTKAYADSIAGSGGSGGGGTTTQSLNQINDLNPLTGHLDLSTTSWTLLVPTPSVTNNTIRSANTSFVQNVVAAEKAERVLADSQLRALVEGSYMTAEQTLAAIENAASSGGMTSVPTSLLTADSNIAMSSYSITTSTAPSTAQTLTNRAYVDAADNVLS